MKTKARLLLVAACLLLLGPGPDAAPAAGPVDHSAWARLLADHVSEKGLVDYNGLARDQAALDGYLAALAGVSHRDLPPRERFAFLINAYNAWTVWFILTQWPDIESIKDLGSLFSSPWKRKIVRLNDGTYTLDNLEHDMLRPEFKDPRIHFAVNCASKGCPPLLTRPYTGADIDARLNEATAKAINDPDRTLIRDGALYVSRIFDWYGEDFDDVAAFVRRHAKEPLKSRIRDGMPIHYLDYDWSLNSR